MSTTAFWTELERLGYVYKPHHSQEATEALAGGLTCIGSLLCAALGSYQRTGQDHVKGGGDLGCKEGCLTSALNVVVLWAEILHPLLY